MFALRFIQRAKRRQNLFKSINDSAERLRVCGENTSGPESKIFWEMAGHLTGIQAQIEEDPIDAARLKRFVSYYSPKIVEICEVWVRLSTSNPYYKNDGEFTKKLHEYKSIFFQAERACFDNDFRELEASISALDTQLKRYPL